jgi:hypothetical protein
MSHLFPLRIFNIHKPILPSSSSVADMAIDPNEPLYCYCQQVSYGEMVACDNDDVSSFAISVKLRYIS